MDYGQSTRINNGPQFEITAGIGNTPENSNPLSQSENLNINEFQTSNRAIGQAGLESTRIPEEDFPDPNAPPRTVELHGSGLGEFTDLSMPPYAPQPNQTMMNQSADNGAAQAQEPKTQLAPDTIDSDTAKHFADGKIQGDDVSYIKSREDELGRGGDAAAFSSWWQEARREARNGQNDRKKVA